MELTFDKAVELLEITDISKISVEQIPQLEKRQKKRWHPDRVAHLNDPSITAEYTVNFQQIEEACQMVVSYLMGTYHAGDAFSFTDKKQRIHEEPEEIIRKCAPEMQTTLKGLWDFIKEKKYKWTVNEFVISDGFKLKDLLQEDFKEDLAMLSVISFFYSSLSLGLLFAIALLIHPLIGLVIGILWLLQIVSCFLGFAPLSRFWLNSTVADVMIKFINLGLGIYNWAERSIQNSENNWAILLVRLPVIFARFMKYVVLYPLTELAKIFVGHKVVGIVKQKVNYYADAAEWYIEELLSKNPNDMTVEELFHLSYINAELSDVETNFGENANKSRHATDLPNTGEVIEKKQSVVSYATPQASKIESSNHQSQAESKVGSQEKSSNGEDATNKSKKNEVLANMKNVPVRLQQMIEGGDVISIIEKIGLEFDIPIGWQGGMIRFIIRTYAGLSNPNSLYPFLVDEYYYSEDETKAIATAFYKRLFLPFEKELDIVYGRNCLAPFKPFESANPIVGEKSKTNWGIFAGIVGLVIILFGIYYFMLSHDPASDGKAYSAAQCDCENEYSRAQINVLQEFNNKFDSYKFSNRQMAHAKLDTLLSPAARNYKKCKEVTNERFEKLKERYAKEIDQKDKFYNAYLGERKNGITEKQELLLKSFYNLADKHFNTIIGFPDKLDKILSSRYGRKYRVLTDNYSNFDKDEIESIIKPNRINDENFPYIMKGDFNGDGTIDCAVLVKDMDEKQFLLTRLAIIWGNNNSITLTDDGCSAITLFKGNVTISGMDGESAYIKNNAISGEIFGKSSWVLYWNGNSFKKVWTSD